MREDRLPDSFPCPQGHVGNFRRRPKRKCRTCNKLNMRAKRAAARWKSEEATRA